MLRSSLRRLTASPVTSLVTSSLRTNAPRFSTAVQHANYECRAGPAPGSPFHLALPVHCMKEARAFYGGILGCEEGRSSVKWQDYSLHGHQLVCHWAGDDYRCTDYYNPVDGVWRSSLQPLLSARLDS